MNFERLDSNNKVAPAHVKSIVLACFSCVYFYIPSPLRLLAPYLSSKTNEQEQEQVKRGDMDSRHEPLDERVR